MCMLRSSAADYLCLLKPTTLASLPRPGPLQMRSFLLCGDAQLHDLHSKLKLDHPHGEANQLHK